MASVLLLLMVRNSLEVDGASYTAGPVRNYRAASVNCRQISLEALSHGSCNDSC
jgi:hypothetical protein